MPKFQDPRTPVRHPETDSAPLTAAERARAIIEQQLAKKQQNSGPPGASGGKALDKEAARRGGQPLGAAEKIG